MTEIVTFGECMGRLTSPGHGPMRHASALALGIAGAESNLAIGLTRLGVSTTWIGRVGDDEFGRLIVQVLRGEGVDVRAITDPAAPTGLLFKERRSTSQHRVTYYRDHGAGSRLAPADLDTDLIAGARILHLTGITPALSPTAEQACRMAIELARANGTVVSLDLNIRRQLWEDKDVVPVLTDLARQSDLIFATREEARALVGDGDDLHLARTIAALGPAEVVIKRGPAGALGFAGQPVEAPLFRVTQVDPVGAGDAFAAGYLSEVLRDADLSQRLATGARCGAFAVTVDGDWEGLPTRSELAELGSGTDVQR